MWQVDARGGQYLGLWTSWPSNLKWDHLGPGRTTLGSFLAKTAKIESAGARGDIHWIMFNQVKQNVTSWCEDEHIWEDVGPSQLNCDQRLPGGTKLKSSLSKLTKIEPAGANGTKLGSCLTMFAKVWPASAMGDTIIMVLWLTMSTKMRPAGARRTYLGVWLTILAKCDRLVPEGTYLG
jgi:hypothetical protein